MPTQSSDDYAKRFAEWQQREAEARRKQREASPPPPDRQYKAYEVLTRELEDQERSRWYRRKILESLDSTPMREVISEANRLAYRNQRMLPWRSSRFHDYLEGRDNNNVDARLYRDWVREKLRGSDLAQRIPDGLQALPDIYEAMREPWRSIGRLNEPRNYEQLVQHLVKHLDWYLDPAQPVKPPIQFVASVLALFGGCVAAFMLLPKVHFDPVFILGPLAAASLIVSFLARIWGRHKTARGDLIGHYPLQQLIHAAELYYYLVEAWVDPQVLEEPKSAEL